MLAAIGAAACADIGPHSAPGPEVGAGSETPTTPPDDSADAAAQGDAEHGSGAPEGLPFDITAQLAVGGATTEPVEEAPPAWMPPEPILDAPTAPILMLGNPTVDGTWVDLWWLPASDDATPPDALTYEVHVLDALEEQPSDSSVILTLNAAGHARVGPFELGSREWITVAAVDADGHRGSWDEPLEMQLPTEPLRLVPGTVLEDWSGLRTVVLDNGGLRVARAERPEPPVAGVVVGLSVAQALEHEQALHRVVSSRAEGDQWQIVTTPVGPQDLIVDGQIAPVVRFFDVPDSLAADYAPAVDKDGWLERTSLLADGVIAVREQIRDTNGQQKSCSGPWWLCVNNVIPSGQTCSTGDIGTASFSGGSRRFAYACHWDSGVSSSVGCDLDNSSAVQTFDAFGQDDNGRRCVVGDAHFAVQGQFGLGGEMKFFYDGDTTRRGIGDDADATPCDDDGSNPYVPDCESSGDRSRAANGESEASLADDRAEVDLNPRLLGGVDIRARADGAAGVGVTYEFYDAYKVLRPHPLVWITIGTRAVGEGLVEAGGTMEATFASDFGRNVGVDVNVIYDGERTGDPGDPYLFSRSSPNRYGPSARFYLSPTIVPSLTGTAYAHARAAIAFYVYARLESTVFFEIGPKAQLDLNMGVGSVDAAGSLPLDCPATAVGPRINRFDLDLLIGPDARFELQWPFTGNPISVFGRTASWQWGPTDPLWSGFTFARRLIELPYWRLLRTEPRGLYSNLTDICPGQRGRICIEVLRQRVPFGIDWSSVDWTLPNNIVAAADPDGSQCVDVFAPVSQAGTQRRIRVSAQPRVLGVTAEVCGEAFYDVGTRATGCHWIGDGYCDSDEECGTTDCPFGGSPRCACGDGLCDNSAGDNCGTCPADCGACTPPVTVVPAGYVRIDTTDNLEVRWNSIDNDGLRSVSLGRDFYIATHETTQQQWFDVMDPVWAALGRDSYSSFAACRADCNSTFSICPWQCSASANMPGTLTPCPDCPAAFVTFRDVLRYLNALSDAEGIPPCYNLSWNPTFEEFEPLAVNAPEGDVTRCVGYRLPTEAEWEYAYRYRPTRPVGSRIRYSDFQDGTNFGSTTVPSFGWIQDSFPTYEVQAMPVGTLAASEAGLFDMTGNVWEWTWTTHEVGNPFAVEAVDPGARSRSRSTDFRVVRGGSFSSPSQWSVGGSNEGFFLFTEDRDTEAHNLGFRPVRTVW